VSALCADLIEPQARRYTKSGRHVRQINFAFSLSPLKLFSSANLDCLIPAGWTANPLASLPSNPA
jgi:hypothetical protein